MIKLPSDEKCFLIEDGYDKYIEKWIKDGEISCKLEGLCEWMGVEYKLKKKDLNNYERPLAREIK